MSYSLWGRKDSNTTKGPTLSIITFEYLGPLFMT